VRQTDALNKKLDREAQRDYVRGQEGEAASLTAEVEESVQELSTFLARGLASARPFEFMSLKRRSGFTPFQAGALGVAQSPPVIAETPALTFLRKPIPGGKRRHAEGVEAA